MNRAIQRGGAPVHIARREHVAKWHRRRRLLPRSRWRRTRRSRARFHRRILRHVPADRCRNPGRPPRYSIPCGRTRRSRRHCGHCHHRTARPLSAAHRHSGRLGPPRLQIHNGRCNHHRSANYDRRIVRPRSKGHHRSVVRCPLPRSRKNCNHRSTQRFHRRTLLRPK